MNRPARVVQSTWIFMLMVQTIGSVDMKRRLPAPKQYVAINVLWGILFLLADTGLGRLAARLSLLTLLTASVVGPFGKKFVQWLGLIAQYFAVPPPPDTPPAAVAGGANRRTAGDTQVEPLLI